MSTHSKVIARTDRQTDRYTQTHTYTHTHDENITSTAYAGGNKLYLYIFDILTYVSGILCEDWAYF